MEKLTFKKRSLPFEDQPAKKEREKGKESWDHSRLETTSRKEGNEQSDKPASNQHTHYIHTYTHIYLY